MWYLYVVVEKDQQLGSLALWVQAGDKIAPDRGGHRALTETSESLEWKDHKKTAFLKRCLNLRKNLVLSSLLAVQKEDGGFGEGLGSSG